MSDGFAERVLLWSELILYYAGPTQASLVHGCQMAKGKEHLRFSKGQIDHSVACNEAPGL